jgi:hypothetical protein
MQEISPGWNGLENKRFQTLHVLGESSSTIGTGTPGPTQRRKILLEHGSIDADVRELVEFAR